MEDIVQEMYISYWNRINSSMLRFTDFRLLKWSIDNASSYEFIPVMGAGETIYVSRTPITNKQYKQFIDETGYSAPSNWTNNEYPQGEDDLPVNYVSYEDALAYCEWLTNKDGTNTYRLPTESEWELAAGHMPKDADFNAGNINDGRTSVYEYDGLTRGAHGAIDFWGNVWEWTSTIKQDDTLVVKGGSYSTPKTDCRTEYRGEVRAKNDFYEDVGFRVIQVLEGKEASQEADLYTLDSPNVNTVIKDDSVLLSWDKIDGAIEYQIFEYDEDKALFTMLDRVSDTSYVVNEAKKNRQYIVQALSYTAISDNVYPNDNTISNFDVNEDDEIAIEKNKSNSNHICYIVSSLAIAFVIIGIVIGKRNK